MKIGERDILIKGKKIKAKITIKEVGDRELLKNLYSDWKKLNDRLKALANKGDILWGISTSGNSKNVIKALEKGREIGTYNFSLTGNNGGRMRELSDLNINIYSNDTPRIQESHQLVYHIICELVENKI